jgi:hypothetical protein
MIRPSLVVVLALGMAVSARAELGKPLNLNKRSAYEDKQFGTKSTSTKQFSTKQYEGQGSYKTTTYSTKEFSNSSKNFEGHASRFSSKTYAAPDVPANQVADADKRFETGAYKSDKKVKTPPTPHQIADKPVRDWKTLIRKEPPRGMPGKHQDLPFARWKVESAGEKEQ